MNKYGETATKGFWEMIAERDAAYEAEVKAKARKELLHKMYDAMNLRDNLQADITKMVAELEAMEAKG